MNFVKKNYFNTLYFNVLIQVAVNSIDNYFTSTLLKKL